MESADADPQQNTAQSPLANQAVQEQKTNKFPLIIIVSLVILSLLVMVAAGYYLYAEKRATNVSQRTTPQADWKTYINNYYNFSLKIPSDWKIEEYVKKGSDYVNGEAHYFRLSSPEGDLRIFDEMPKNIFPSNSDWLGDSDIQVGKYTVKRTAYRAGRNSQTNTKTENKSRVDSVRLDYIKRQKNVTFYISDNEDFEKNGDLLQNILKSFIYTKQEPSLDDYISYTIPNTWKKEDTDTSQDLSFVSSDFFEEGLPTIVTGARIEIGRFRNDPKKTLIKQISPHSIYGAWNLATRSATFNSYKYTNEFACAGEFGGCSDKYALEKDGYIWMISMTCNKNCDTKTGIDGTIYAKNRDYLLNSIKFK